MRSLITLSAALLLAAGCGKTNDTDTATQDNATPPADQSTMPATPPADQPPPNDTMTTPPADQTMDQPPNEPPQQ